MITYHIWDEYISGFGYATAFEYFCCLIASVFTVPLDIVLSPFELIGFIIYKIREGK